MTFVCGRRSRRVEGSVSALAERWRVNAAVVTVSGPWGARRTDAAGTCRGNPKALVPRIVGAKRS